MWIVNSSKQIEINKRHNDDLKTNPFKSANWYHKRFPQLHLLLGIELKFCISSMDVIDIAHVDEWTVWA